LNLVEKKISSLKPNVAIIKGPFFSKFKKTCIQGFYLNREDPPKKVEFDAKEDRESILNAMIGKINKETPHTKIVIVPDVDEVDSLFPVPVPQEALPLKGRNVEGSPCLFKLADAVLYSLTLG